MATKRSAPSSREPEIEVPLPVAPLSARLMAGLTDLGVVMAAGLLFAAMAWHALPGIPHAKPFWMTLGAVTVLLWAVYQHLFLLYAGRTLGMSLQGIRLSTFDGRRRRGSSAAAVRVLCSSPCLRDPGLSLGLGGRRCALLA